MPSFDTNERVRHAVQDDRGQLEAAKGVTARCIDAGPSLFVPVTATLGLEWVLRSPFGCAKDDVIHVRASLFLAVELNFESERALEVALKRYREGAADFTDDVHAAQAWQAGEQPLWALDRRASKVPWQVESDASIRWGSPAIASNIDLLRAVRAARC